MTNTALLLEYIRNSGLKKSFICEKLGLSRAGFWKKVENLSEFKPSEINLLCKLLGINGLPEKERVFFAEEVADKAT